jgi:hypothetical protein
LRDMTMRRRTGVIPMQIKRYNVFQLMQIHSIAGGVENVIIDKVNNYIVNIDIVYITNFYNFVPHSKNINTKSYYE